MAWTLDLLIVPGCGKKESIRRAESALNLAFAGDFPVFATGNKPRLSYESMDRTEAEYISATLIRGKIIKSRIIVDKTAQSTYQNFFNCCMLEEYSSAKTIGIMATRAVSYRFEKLAKKVFDGKKIIIYRAEMRNTRDFLFEALALLREQLRPVIPYFFDIFNFFKRKRLNNHIP